MAEPLVTKITRYGFLCTCMSLVCLSITSIQVSGCRSSRDPNGPLFGKWVEVNGHDNIEFAKDGLFLGRMTSGIAGEMKNISGNYFVDSDNISLQPNGGVPMTWKFKFSNGYLILTYQQGGSVKEDGSLARFERAK